jgi:RNA polymerase sigma-70 factor (ECF subfamily)
MRNWPAFTSPLADEPAAKLEALKPPPVDAAQLQLLRAGDNAAWAQFVETWGPRLFAYLRYSLPTREDAEDVLSETMVASIEAIKNFDSKSQLSTWLYAIARRKVADYWRKAGRATEELSDLFQSAPNGFSLEFREAIASLPENTRQALLLRYREGFSVSEVAQILGRSYKATESLLSRARSLLAQQLKREK